MAELTRTDLAGPAEADPVSKVVYVGPSISWRGIFAGAFVGVLVFLIIGMLGVALTGISIKSIAQHGSGTVGLMVAAAIWTLFSSIVSMFVGGYVAGRASGVLPTRIGAIEGLVVASMVFAVFFLFVGTSIGTVGTAAGTAVSAVGTGATNLASNQQVQSAIQQSLGDLNLRSSPAMVAAGVTTRLLSGDEQSAVNYLANQAGIPRSEASQRLDRIKGQIVGVARGAGNVAGNVTQAFGWTFFVSLVLGSFFALWGGALGVRRNIQHPLSERDRRMAIEARPEWYGWAYGGPSTPTPAHST